MSRIGVLTGGGECPGLNAVICGIVVRANELGHEVVGFRRGWRGLLNHSQPIKLERDDVEDIQQSGGTILGASRVDPFAEPGGPEQIVENLKRQKCDMLVVVGGDQTLTAAVKLSKMGVKLVGIPKTLDNNLLLTDYTFGFVTACNIAMESIERLYTSAKSRECVMVVELLGRKAGWIALYSGLSAGAHLVLIPEIPFNIKAVCDHLKKRKKAGKPYAVVVLAQGARPADAKLLKEFEKHRATVGPRIDSSGIAGWLAGQVKKRTGLETEGMELGHIQRSGAPTALDRMLGMRLGIKAVDLAHNGEFGQMAALHGAKITGVPLVKAIKTIKTVPAELYQEMSMFFH